MPEAIHLIEKNLDKIEDWDYLSLNPAAIHLLNQYPEKINWQCFSQNPAIIEDDIIQYKKDLKLWVNSV